MVSIPSNIPYVEFCIRHCRDTNHLHSAVHNVILIIEIYQFKSKNASISERISYFGHGIVAVKNAS